MKERRRYGEKRRDRYAGRLHKRVTWTSPTTLPTLHEYRRRELVSFRGVPEPPPELVSSFAPGVLYFTCAPVEFIEEAGIVVMNRIWSSDEPQRLSALFLGCKRVEQYDSMHSRVVDVVMPVFLVEGRQAIVPDLSVFDTGDQ